MWVLQDPCHELAWVLDAAIAQNRSSPQQDKGTEAIKPAHMMSLKKFFRELEARVRQPVLLLPIIEFVHSSLHLIR